MAWCNEHECPENACGCFDQDFDDVHDFDDDNDFEPGIDEDRDEEFEEALANCAAMPSGHCGKAGSEECDIECPFRADADRRLQRASKREERKP